MMKRYISVILVVAMIMAMVSVSASAHGLENNVDKVLTVDEFFDGEFTAAEQRKVNREIDLLVKHYLFIPEVCEILSIEKERNDVVYMINYNGFPTEIIVNENTQDNTVTFYIREGEKHDVITFETDKIYLDGKVVKCSGTMRSESLTRAEINDINLRSSNDTIYEPAPYGYISDYNVLVDIAEVESIAFEKAIGTLTVAGFTAIITGAISLYFLGAMVTTLSLMATKVSAIVYNWITGFSPLSEYASFITYFYYHEDADADDGYIDDYGATVIKESSRWYAHMGFSGTPTQTTTFSEE